LIEESIQPITTNQPTANRPLTTHPPSIQTTCSPSPSPSPSPPPPAAVLLPSTPLGATSLPFSTPLLNIGDGSTAALPAAAFAGCRNFARAAAARSGRKQVFSFAPGEMTGARISVDTCAKVNRVIPSWDSVLAVLRCNAAMTACTCFDNDDGGSGCGLQSRARWLPQSAAQPNWYAMVAPYSAGTSAGRYYLSVRAL
jgi:hypothetical protein